VGGHETKFKHLNHLVVVPDYRLANENWTARIELDCDRSNQKNWCKHYQPDRRHGEIECTVDTWECRADTRVYPRHALRIVTIEGAVEDSQLVPSRHFQILGPWIEFDYFRAGTSWRHPGAYFCKSNRYVLSGDSNASLTLPALAIEILGSPCRQQSDVNSQRIGQQSNSLGCGLSHGAGNPSS
jgi:hypothetical protein